MGKTWKRMQILKKLKAAFAANDIVEEAKIVEPEPKPIEVLEIKEEEAPELTVPKAAPMTEAMVQKTMPKTKSARRKHLADIGATEEPAKPEIKKEKLKKAVKKRAKKK